jgi:hypothetical protein
MGPKTRRALHILNAHPEGMFADDFYKEMWPERWAQGFLANGHGLTGGSSKGGPSNVQCAVNWFLGRIAAKYKGAVLRYGFLDDDRGRAGRWFIQSAGREALKKD